MAITEQITCDVCGKSKGSVNHWWMLGENPKELVIRPYVPSLGWKHLCGQQCVIKAVSEWMQK